MRIKDYMDIHASLPPKGAIKVSPTETSPLINATKHDIQRRVYVFLSHERQRIGEAIKKGLSPNTVVGDWKQMARILEPNIYHVGLVSAKQGLKDVNRPSSKQVDTAVKDMARTRSVECATNMAAYTTKELVRMFSPIAVQASPESDYRDAEKKYRTTQKRYNQGKADETEVNRATQALYRAQQLRGTPFSRVDNSNLFGTERAEIVADYETARALGYGRLAGWQAGSDQYLKAWFTSVTHPLDDVCDDNEDDGAIEIDEAFTSGDMTTPAHPNCECTVVLVPMDEA